MKLSEGKPEYTFYDGPPFATGLPHYGHILAGTIKDTVTRYATQVTRSSKSNTACGSEYFFKPSDPSARWSRASSGGESEK